MTHLPVVINLLFSSISMFLVIIMMLGLPPEPLEAGDANADQTVRVADAFYLINYVFMGGPAPDPLQAGDANCDGQVNVADAVYLINYVFKEGPEPCCP